MPEQASAEIVREKWNATMRQRVESRVRKFSWHSTTVQQFMRDNYTDGLTDLEYLARYLGDRPLARALDIGGGHGEMARQYQKRLKVGHFEVIDISDFAVRAGQERAEREGLRMTFLHRDMNRDPLPEQSYDLIMASGALHHIENLEHLFEQITLRLAPGGVFFAKDYMGPNHMQWRPKQLALMNAIVGALPDDMNRVAHKTDAVIREITPIPLEIFARVDPSEGVRSEDIFTVMEQHLDIDRVVPLGQTIVYEALRGRIQNFDDADPRDAAILSLACLLEKELIDAGVLTSDFNLVFARKKSA